MKSSNNFFRGQGGRDRGVLGVGVEGQNVHLNGTKFLIDFALPRQHLQQQ